MTVSPVKYCNILVVYSVCIINKINIAISIGFELPSYTYNEPMFEMQINENFSSPNNLTAYGPVYLIKENNVTSEQMFGIVIQVSDAVPGGTNPAALTEDYDVGGGRIVTIPFPSNLQRVNYEFRLLPDTIPEWTEAFLACSSRANMLEVDGRVFTLPHYQSPVFASASINILDDDREFTLVLQTIIV